MKRILHMIALAALAACGGAAGDTTAPPADTTVTVNRGPANVVISNVRRRDVDIDVFVATIHAKNEGGDGSYRIGFFAPPSVPNGPRHSYGTTEPVTVTYPYEEDVAYELTDSALWWIVVYNRGTNTATWTKTQCLTVVERSPCPPDL